MNFAPNKGRAGELLALLDAAPRRRRRHQPGHLPLPARRDHPLGGAAQLVVGRQPGRHPAAAARPGRRCDRIREDLEVNGSDGCHGVVADWDTIEISGVRQPGARRGGRAHRRAARRRPRRRAVRRLLRPAGPRPTWAPAILQHVGHEENVRAIMQHPLHTGGSDGLLVGDKPHPRAWGTFPRYLGHYCRELGRARPGGLRRPPDRPPRGPAAADRSRAGARAATPPTWCCSTPTRSPTPPPSTNPRQQAAGIHYVLVNGAARHRRRSRTGARAGRALRRQQDGSGRRRMDNDRSTT